MKTMLILVTLIGCVGCKTSGFNAGYIDYRNTYRGGKGNLRWTYAIGYKDGWLKAAQELGPTMSK